MELVWWNMNKHTPRVSAHVLKINDYVRIIMNTKQFQKEGTPSWSKELFQVNRVLQTAPRTYKIQDLHGDVLIGTFYREELQRVLPPANEEYNIERVISTRGKGKDKEILVKWEGYPHSFNSWIKSKTVTLKK